MFFRKEVYAKPIHPYAFKHPSGVYGKITGLFNFKPSKKDWRLCYRLTWDDMDDYVPNDGSFEIVNERREENIENYKKY